MNNAMLIWDLQKQDGVKHHLDKRGNTNSGSIYSRSVCNYGKNDKLRGARRRADRHGHHRRRQIFDNSIRDSQKVDEEPSLPDSTSCLQKRKPRGNLRMSVSQLCTNRKAEGRIRFNFNSKYSSWSSCTHPTIVYDKCPVCLAMAEPIIDKQCEFQVKDTPSHSNTLPDEQ